MINVSEKSIRVHGEKVILTKDTIVKTREWFIQNELGCIAEVESGEVYLNPEYGFDRYKGDCLSNIEKIKQGEWDHSLTFVQRAYYIQSGKSVGLLG